MKSSEYQNHVQKIEIKKSEEKINEILISIKNAMFSSDLNEVQCSSLNKNERNWISNILASYGYYTKISRIEKSRFYDSKSYEKIMWKTKLTKSEKLINSLFRLIGLSHWN